MDLSFLKELNMLSMILRICCAVLAGGLIGSEREKRRRPAGLRTHILVSLGAALTIILGQYLEVMINGAWSGAAQIVGLKTDTSRFGAQVINGVGFLGAGTIIVTGRQEVKGLTTAAGLWASACMGLAAGAGFYECVAICVLLMFLIMRFMPRFESYMLAKARGFNLYVEIDSINNLSTLISRIKSMNIKFHNMEMNKAQQGNSTQINVLMNLRLPKRQNHVEVLAELSCVDGIISMEEI